jgi:predicted RNA-binding protein associated with RNAse of E/G family
VTPRTITIHYGRLPDRVAVFDQVVVDETPECTVTLIEESQISRPVLAGGRVVLEPGGPAVWFTFPGRWHDIGRFHLSDGSFTGYYANILTPPRMEYDRWETMDLCLDLWLSADGQVEILDEDEFQEAVERGWMDDATARTARAEVEALASAARAGLWPSAEVRAWDLDRARRAALST